MFIKDADTLLKGVALTALLRIAVFAQPPATPAEKLYSDYIQPVFQKS